MNIGHIRVLDHEVISRRARRKERTRRALLDVALAYFARRGIYGTRIEDITDQADLGKGAFYNYFDSKDDLVATLLAEAVEILDRDYLSRAAPSAGLAERVRSLATEHERFFETHRDYPVLFHQARGLLMLDSSSASRLRLVMRDYLARLERKLSPASEASAASGTALYLDAAAAFAGVITGYRSHALAAALPVESKTVVAVASFGLVGLLEKRALP
ncbi:MAG: TetR/AcrR family transcriptional regulator [Vicinamibacteria bacterium]|nr:TetR/AcrR family transcriptional regulator [Vicinamibacteria bacterium]